MPKIGQPQYTLREIHKAIRANNNLRKTAEQLNISVSILNIYLSQLREKFIAHKLIINFTELRYCTEERAIILFKDTYDKYISIQNIKLAEVPFIKIHQAIQNALNMTDAAEQYLGVKKDVLCNYLEKLQAMLGINSNSNYN